VCPILMSYCNHILDFSSDFRTSPKTNFTKIHPVGAVMIHADRQTRRRS